MIFLWRKLGRAKFLSALSAFVVGYLFLIAGFALGLNAGDLAERIILLVISRSRALIHGF